MQIVYCVIVLALLILSFIAGIKLDNYYHVKASIEQKEALEKQFVRLRVGADFDDPCKPYGMPQYSRPIPVMYHPSSGPITQEFMDELKTTGRAKTSFRKSDSK